MASSQVTVIKFSSLHCKFRPCDCNREYHINLHRRAVAAMAQPVAGVKVVPPLVHPQPGQVVTHYEMFQPQVKQSPSNPTALLACPATFVLDQLA